MYRCPRALGNDDESSILPFFFDYRNSDYLAWPDGRGRLFQPSKLVQAFDVLLDHVNRKIEKESRKNVG